MSDPSHLIFNILIFTGILVVLLTPFLECPLNYSNKSVRLKICKILLNHSRNILAPPHLVICCPYSELKFF